MGVQLTGGFSQLDRLLLREVVPLLFFRADFGQLGAVGLFGGQRLLGMSVARAVEMLRANGKIDAARVDEETGEVLPSSESTVTRALREYKLHPDQLLQPAPVNRMKSEHPNHCWQIDPSLCVLYYLPRSGEDSGLRVMKQEEFYKNKPKNVVKIENDRVWRYTGTDYASGTILARYYFGGETSANLCDFFIFMMQEKADILKDPFRGVPRLVMLDPGSANTSAAFKNLCKSLDVHVQINKPGNPRAKGQVEKGNDIVETAFESSLRFTEVHDIGQLNRLAERWMRYYNGTQKHSRHGLTRYQAWNKIKAEQLILPPPADYCRELAVSAPKEAKVSPDLEIRFGGRVYSVKDIKGVLVGQKLLVAKNPWEPTGARIATYDSDGNEIWQAVPEVVFDEMGFRADAAVIGAEYKGQADTIAQSHAKELDKLAMQADTLEAAAAMRNDGELRYDGKRLLNVDDLSGMIPSGAVLYFAGQTAPSGWLKANGAAVSRTAYAALFAAIGTTYGAGDGSTTFNLPDLRGEFMRGWDDGRGIDRGRAFGSAQGDAIRNITGSLSAPHGFRREGGRVLLRRHQHTPAQVPRRQVGRGAATQPPTTAGGDAGAAQLRRLHRPLRQARHLLLHRSAVLGL